jgi:hypothetical protein
MPIKKKAKRIFVTITDMAALVMAVIYITFVCLMTFLDIGPFWLNIGLLVVTVLYVIFFLIKIFYLNKTDVSPRFKRTAKFLKRYTKKIMRLINAVFVILGFVSVNVGMGHLVPMIGLVFFGMTFVVSIMWDVALFFIKRKINAIMADWNAMDSHEKKDKIDYLIEKFLETLDGLSIAGYEDIIVQGSRATEIIGEKVTKAKKKVERETGS